MSHQITSCHIIWLFIKYVMVTWKIIEIDWRGLCVFFLMNELLLFPIRHSQSITIMCCLQMLAFASLNSMLSLDKSGQWLGFMTSKGYVEHFVKSPSLSYVCLQMLAFASLNSVLSLDKSGQWLGFMTSKGYVEHFVKSLQQDDVHLQAMLSPQPEPLKALYIYEAKMVSSHGVLLSAPVRHLQEIY